MIAAVRGVLEGRGADHALVAIGGIVLRVASSTTTLRDLGEVGAPVALHTYLHVRDGSGDPAAGTHDLVVTTEATPAVGDTILVEGVVAIDRDIGAGYTFATLVEDARIATR